MLLVVIEYIAQTMFWKKILRRIKDRDCSTYIVLYRDRVGLEV